MRHGMKGRKFGRSSAHRKSMLMNLARSLVLFDRIQTTLAKAKDLRPYVEKIVTIAKKQSLQNRRRLLATFRGDSEVVERLFSVVAARCASRNGGYTRILKNGFRPGDNSPVGLIEFVDSDFVNKHPAPKETKSSADNSKADSASVQKEEA